MHHRRQWAGFQVHQQLLSPRHTLLLAVNASALHSAQGAKMSTATMDAAGTSAPAAGPVGSVCYGPGDQGLLGLKLGGVLALLLLAILRHELQHTKEALLPSAMALD